MIKRLLPKAQRSQYSSAMWANGYGVKLLSISRGKYLVIVGSTYVRIDNKDTVTSF